MAKKRQPTSGDEPADDGRTTTIRVTFETRDLIFDLARAKGVSIPQLLDDLLGARLRDELIGITEARLRELRSKK
jgi:hypothetical protein